MNYLNNYYNYDLISKVINANDKSKNIIKKMEKKKK